MSNTSFHPVAQPLNERTIVAYVEDRPGVLNRIASLFRRRAYNISSLNVGRTHEPGVSRMTIVVEDADDDTTRRIEANLYKMVNVLRVEDITHAPHVARVLALVKVRAEPDHRTELLQLCEVFRARVVDIAPHSLVVEITGSQSKIDALITAFEPFGIIEMAQNGAVTMLRGERPTASGAPQSRQKRGGDEDAA